MRTYCNFRHASACSGPLLLLVGLLALGGRPVAAQGAPAAQAADTVPLQMIFVVFPNPNAAGQAMANLSDAQREHAESYAMVSKDTSGKVRVQEKHDKQGRSKTTQRASRSIDGVVALLGRSPARGGDSGGAGGPRAGAMQAGVSPASVTRMRNMLAPGNAALIFVVEGPYANDLESSMRGANGQVFGADMMPEPQ